MKPRRPWGRKAVNLAVAAGAVLAAASGIAVLFWIMITVLLRGWAALNLDFFTNMPTPPGVPGGGLFNAIGGTLILTLLATAAAVPLGLLSGIFLAEFGQDSRVADHSRFAANVLMGMPSIIVGVFAYAVLVVTLGNFSGYAGAFALFIIMLPVISRTTEDMLRLVPNTLREAALALGFPRWRVTLSIVFRAAKSGLLTGILLAVARVSGETAPLLFTALNSPFQHFLTWNLGLDQPYPNLTVTIFNYAMSPYPDWQTKAWGASLLITVGILVLTLLGRWLIREPKV
uniref:Phosphate transport system permease protein PstA n=1 Tax=Desulfobacca acetoxidans TaxID=60893 RepID=A0A7C3Z3A5_9BACT